jgi:hypothetical protein
VVGSDDKQGEDMKMRWMRVCWVVFALLAAPAAHAALHDRGGGLIYDDVLNITWLQDANYAQTSGYDISGRMTWEEAVTWAANLVYGGYDDWRLASISVDAGVPTGVEPIVLRCDPDEVRCRNNEIGYMFYWNLGGTYGENKMGSQTSISGVQLFNIQRTYWTGTEFKDVAYTGDGRAWTFPFESGIRNPNDKTLSFSAWAVRAGDVVGSNQAPKISSVSATPSTIWDNQQSQLVVTASDSDGPSALSYQWTVLGGGGSLSSATSASPWYTPGDVIGTQTVTLRVTVSDGAASVSRDVSLTVQDANPPPPGAVLLTEGFGAGVPTGWSYYDEGTISAPSNWRVVGGELAQQSNIRDEGTANDLAKRGTYLLNEDGLGWTSYKAKFKLRSTDDDTLGLMFRYIDEDNWYRFSWDAQLKQRRLVKKAGGAYTLLAADNVPYVVGRSYQVEVVAQNSQLEVWIDGMRVLQANDASHNRGSVAFYTWQNNGAYFDDLVIEDLSGGAFNVLPKITALSATPAAILDNQQSQLAVTASDSDGPSALSYQWAVLSGGGSLSGANSASPMYTPSDVVGTQTVTLRVTVSDGAASVNRDLTVSVQDANPPPLGPLLLAQDFSAGVPADWSYYDEGTISAPSKWRVVSGELAQQSNIRDESTANSLVKRGTYLLYEAGDAWRDYRAKFKLRSSDDDTLGAMFRFIDANNYYRFSWDAQLKQRQLVKKVGGVYTLLAADSVPYVVGRNYQVEIVAKGGQLEVWVDGARVFQISDASLPSGTFGFYTWQNNGAFFDDLQVNASP